MKRSNVDKWIIASVSAVYFFYTCLHHTDGETYKATALLMIILIWLKPNKFEYDTKFIGRSTATLSIITIAWMTLMTLLGEIKDTSSTAICLASAIIVLTYTKKRTESIKNIGIGGIYASVALGIIAEREYIYMNMAAMIATFSYGILTNTNKETEEKSRNIYLGIAMMVWTMVTFKSNTAVICIIALIFKELLMLKNSRKIVNSLGKCTMSRRGFAWSFIGITCSPFIALLINANTNLLNVRDNIHLAASSIGQRIQIFEETIGNIDGIWINVAGNGLSSSTNEIKGIITGNNGVLLERNLSSHNTLMEIFYRCGWIGLTMFIGVLVILAVNNSPKQNKSTTRALTFSIDAIVISASLNLYRMGISDMMPVLILLLIFCSTINGGALSKRHKINSATLGENIYYAKIK